MTTLPDSLADLLSRRSQKMVRAPAPDATQLRQILEAAVRAPDHSSLRAWRFALVEQQDIAALTDIAIEASRRSGMQIKPEKEKNMRAWLSQVPLLIGLAY